MNTNLINSQIKRASRNLFIVNLISLIVSVGILSYYCGEFKNIIFGPKHMRVGETWNIKISGQDARNYISITPEQKASTGVQYIRTEYDRMNREKSRTVRAVYYVLKDGQDLIIAKIPPNKVESFSYTGWVRKMTSEEKNELYRDISMLKENNYTVSEYILDAEQFPDSLLMYTIFGVLLVLNLINIFRSVGYFNSPKNHKIYKKLMKYGDADVVINSIEQELPYDLLQNRNDIYFLKSWILSKKFFAFDVYKIDDIIWVYKKVTNHSINFIPTGKTYELILSSQNGTQRPIRLKQQQIDYVLISINQMCPWIIIGFTERIYDMWKSNYSQLVNYVQLEKQKIINNNP